MTIQFIDAVPLDAFCMEIAEDDMRELHQYLPPEKRGDSHAAREALADSIRSSTGAWSAMDSEGKHVAIFGYSADLFGAYPWVICGPRARLHGKTLMRTARAFLAGLKENFGCVSNITPEKSPKHRRFLSALRFAFQPAPEGLSRFTLT